MAISHNRTTSRRASGGAGFEDMGRRLKDTSWLGQFQDDFRALIAGRDISLHLRKTPGIMYVLGDEIEEAATHRGETVTGVRNTSEAVERLVRKNVLDSRFALRGLTVFTDHLHLKEINQGGGSRRFNIGVKVTDCPTGGYPDFIIAGEKEAVRDELNVHYTPQSYPGVGPQHVLALGTVTCRGEHMSHQTLEEMPNIRGVSLPLGPVEPMWAYHDSYK